MTSRTLLSTALTLTALGLVPGAAPLLELPVKLSYSPRMYADVTSTLYTWYGVVGGSIQIAALLTVLVLAFQARHLPYGALAVASAAALLASLLLWGFVVAPVNAAWADAEASGSAELVAAYADLRSRWEFGHLAAFIAWLTGWFGLVAATVRPEAANTN